MATAGRMTTVAVIFGGRSVEHDVSIVTGQQIMRAFDSARYQIVPLYIDREGRWWTGDALRMITTFEGDVSAAAGVQTAVLSPAVNHHGLIINPQPKGVFAKSTINRIDVVFPALHGTHGEDGTLQGLLELADIPYVGCGVLASAVANDKWLTKTILKAAGLPVVPGIRITRADWDADPDAQIATVVSAFPTYPLFVKPATLGSSIGIGRATDAKTLRVYLDLAFSFDRRVVVESAITDCVEINCALIGDARNCLTSVLEQPVSWEQFLSFEDKYLRGSEGMKSAERLIPAPIPDDLTTRIQALARDAFAALEASGTARIDFLVRPDAGEVYLNEINTLPGSLAFYLWQETGMSARQVVDRLIALARDTYADKRRSTYDYRTGLIGVTAARGLKGTKK